MLGDRGGTVARDVGDTDVAGAGDASRSTTLVPVAMTPIYSRRGRAAIWSAVIGALLVRRISASAPRRTVSSGRLRG